jgi:hypothetical protein
VLDGIDIDGLTLPGDAFRQLDFTTFVGWNAHALEQGQTAFSSAGIDVIDPESPITAYAAYVIGQGPDDGGFGLADVPKDMWLLVVAYVNERKKGWAGRVLEVRAAAFRAQPETVPPPHVMAGLYKAAESYRVERERMGVPIGRSLYDVRD